MGTWVEKKLRNVKCQFIVKYKTKENLDVMKTSGKLKSQKSTISFKVETKRNEKSKCVFIVDKELTKSPFAKNQMIQKQQFDQKSNENWPLGEIHGENHVNVDLHHIEHLQIISNCVDNYDDGGSDDNDNDGKYENNGDYDADGEEDDDGEDDDEDDNDDGEDDDGDDDEHTDTSPPSLLMVKALMVILSL